MSETIDRIKNRIAFLIEDVETDLQVHGDLDNYDKGYRSAMRQVLRIIEAEEES